MSQRFQIWINGEQRSVQVDGDRTLLSVLRDDLGLTGTKYGCGEGQCGACMVLLDGRATNSCITPISSVGDKKVTTIEGLAKGETLHPVQAAFLEEDALQCGYCTSGMIISAVSLLNEAPHPTSEQIVHGMNRNVCRCCTYQRIRNAIVRASQAPAKSVTS
ncbi:MAG TPA: (2Fe-2S)-binding protein [Opitutaceae bacterium]|nr:(2Fe-2S)-binding protein [Opitutaceae bacterium]